MYKGQDAASNQDPINRFIVNSSMLPEMTNNSDGSVTICVQNDSPGRTLHPTGFPRPNGPIYLVMRSYWPEAEAPSVLPPGEGPLAAPGTITSK